MKRIILIPIISALLLSACVTDIERQQASTVITALPQEVAGCTFLANVDTTARATITNARFDLRLQAANVGATHVVETHVYTSPIGFYYSPDVGVALSGRAYLCPKGLGPILAVPQQANTVPAK